MNAQLSFCPNCKRQTTMFSEEIICAPCLEQTTDNRLAVALAFLNQLYRRAGNFLSTGGRLFSYAIELAWWTDPADPTEPRQLWTSDSYKLWTSTGAALSPTTEAHMAALKHALELKMTKEIQE